MKHEHIISRGYLSKLVLSALAVMAVGAAISVVLLHINVNRTLDTHYSAILSVITEVRDTLFIKTLVISGVFALLVAAGLFALVVFHTHRIAGPLHRVKVSAKAIGEGRLSTKVTFRDKDVIHPFAEAVNEMTGNYSDDVELLESEIRQLKGAVTDLRSRLESGGDTKAALIDLVDRDRMIKDHLDKIRL